jgi:hypothetical protein
MPTSLYDAQTIIASSQKLASHSYKLAHLT